ncbi:MAG: hypothetical protein M3Q42_03390 [Pseudomonadota bacterium]|nr:hypothetical protein [Pseudomonadota bacterium]
MNQPARLALTALVVALAGCAPRPSAETATAAAAIPAQTEAATKAAVRTPADQFYANLKDMCGQAFAGRVAMDTPATPGPNPFADKPLIMHVRGCGDDELRVPFHVGEDRSRTWAITRLENAEGETRLRLKHDHRHEDGTDDATTMYGGDSVAAGTAERQEFPVDEFSKALFEKEGLTASVTNTWAIELRPGEEFVYELSRPGGRMFRVEFDLTEAVEVPAAPWGDEG